MKSEERPRRMLLARRAAAFVGLAVAAASMPLVEAAPPSRKAAIAALLRRRAVAIVERNEKAFLSTISPLASRAFVGRQRAGFRRLADVDLAGYVLRARWDVFGDLVRASDRARYPGTEDVAIPLTQERLMIDGFDRTPAVEDLFLTFVRDRGRWGIAADDDLADLGLLSARRIWEFGPVITSESDHFLLLHHPEAPPPPDALALAEEALARVDRYWGGRWQRRVPIVMPADEDELQRMLQLTVDLSDFVAFAYSTIDDFRDHRFTGPRVLLNPRAVAGRSNSSVLGILAHELAHVATRRRSGPLVPSWVEEGLAEEVRYRGDDAVLAEVGSGAFDGRFPRDVEFRVGDLDGIRRAYLEGYAAVRFFLDRFGLEAFRRFYGRLGRARVAFGTQRFHVDRALRATSGVSLREFERAWAVSIDPL